MRVDPITDFATFLTKPFYAEPSFLHYIYWMLAILSLSIAVAAWSRLPGQRRGVNIMRFCVRFLIGSFWWQQSLWKFPTDLGGLRYWTEQEVQHAAFAFQGQLIKAVILPVFQPFAYGVYAFEVIVAVAIMLGLYTRLVSTLGMLLILNLFLGLYRAPQEWPWSYVFLIVIMVIMAVENFGLALGLDAFIEARSPNARRSRAAAMG